MRPMMMMLLVLVPFVGIAQATPRQDNLRDFDFATSRIESSYGGWQSKTAGPREAEIKTLTARLREKVSAGDTAVLRGALTEYVGWFDDGHIQLSWIADAPNRKWPRLKRSVSESEARRRLARLGSERRPVEGLWTIDDRYRLVVLRSDRTAARFDAIVLSTAAEGWGAGDLKATLRSRADGGFDVRYGFGDRTEGRFVARLRGNDNILTLGDAGGSWRRSFDNPAEQTMAERRFPADTLGMKRINKDTLHLRIPSFGVDQAAPIAALIAANAADLAATPYLVIDIRDNGGGSDASYDPILDLIWTRPVTKIGTELRVSADNIRLLGGLATQVERDAPTIAADIRRVVARMRAADRPFILTEERSFEIIGRGSIKTSPRRVALLIDGAISAAEHLILAARQSDKVVLMGQANSAGVLDFGNIVGETSPSGRFSLGWATSRSLRLPGDPVDPDGIAPQVRIPDGVTDPVAYAARWLAGRDALDAAALPIQP
jgi:Peptidase family S41